MRKPLRAFIPKPLRAFIPKPLRAFIPKPLRALIPKPLRALLVAALLGLGGCYTQAADGSAGDDAFQDLREFMRTVQQASVPPAPRLEPGPTYQPFIYAGAHLPSPFVVSTGTATGSARAGQGADVMPPPPHVKQHLETFPMAELALVGILSNARVTLALIEDGKARVHRVQPGSYLGNQGGQVTSITDTSIRIKEILADGAGGWFEKHSQWVLTDQQPK